MSRNHRQDLGRSSIGRGEAQSSSSYQLPSARSNADAETRSDEEREAPRIHARKSVPDSVSSASPLLGIKRVRASPQSSSYAPRSGRQDGNFSDNTNTRSGPVRRGMEPPQSLPRRVTTAASSKSTFSHNEDRFRQHRASAPMEPITPGSRMRSTGTLGRKSALATSHTSEPQRRASNPSHMTSSPISHPKSLISKPAKSTNYIIPMWQYQDEQHDARVKHMTKKPSDFEPRTRLGSNKRARESTMSAMSAAVRRMSVKPRNPRGKQTVIRDRGPELARLKGVIAPNLLLTNDGELDNPDSDDSMGDNARFQPQPKTAPRKVIQSEQIAIKRIRAARKVESIDAPSEEQEESSASSSSSDNEVDHRDAEIHQAEADMDLEVLPIALDPPPVITIPLRQIAPQVRPPSPPTETLVAAIELLALASFRMQETMQLPFLRRQVRSGFISRCKSLGVPIAKVAGPISLLVRYEYAGEASYETTVNSWLCPLCEIHDTFNTREMLVCHLKWDHAEVFVEWDKSNAESQIVKWVVKVLIPEPLDEPMVQPNSRSQTVELQRTATPAVDPAIPSNAPSLPVNIFSPSTQGITIKSERPTTPPPVLKEEPIDSLFPYVTIPPSPSASTAEALPGKLKFQEVYYPTPTPHTSQSVRSTSSRVRSTATPSASLRPSGRKPRQSNSNFPMPPPPDDSLGPAARRPYLPAKSDYGGPTVYYSCRPGGECLYDLLGTLPMEQFGVLDWAILDREEEIYEADDVLEEYKVMHALWARWIFLNRNKFIANYHQGTIAFVDEYWKMIHRAAGWDALRYWLLMLLANRFLTGANVADILKHYEGLTGMDSWYD